jgi:hypothetical protein
MGLLSQALRAVMAGAGLLAASACSHQPPSAAPASEYVNGRWFDGERFQARTLYAVDGRLRSSRPNGRRIQTVDLQGGFVVPPYGEAHNHNLEQSPRLEQTICRYLADGVFYVRNPNSLPRLTPTLQRAGQGLEAVFAHAGVTGRGGHPIGVVERMLKRGAWTNRDGEGAFYVVVEDARDLEAKWPQILGTGTNFVKVYLLYSEEYPLRNADSRYEHWRGLDPVVLPQIVERAHRTGLQVMAHVESAADFRTAIKAGVDEIVHMPGLRPDRDDFDNYGDGARYRITDADAAAAAAKKIAVTTTIGELLTLVSEPGFDAGQASVIRELHSHNLRVLRRHGVKLLVGSDAYGDTSRKEFDELARLGVFTNAELLRMWSSAAPRAIFPNRRIGRLEPGYEASFLVLGQNPLASLAATADIRLRVKLGLPTGCSGS